MSDLNKFQKGLMITLYILTAIALGVSAFVIYTIAVKEKPWTIGVTYASELTANDNQVNICTVSIHDNFNNNGQSLYELQFNSYTDSEGNGVAGFGIQIVGDWQVWNADRTYENYIAKDSMSFSTALQKYNSRGLTQNLSFILGDAYLYYTGDDGKIYYSLSAEDLDNYLLIDIDGQFYRMTLKNYDYESIKDGFWNELFNRTETRQTPYSWFEVFDVIIKSALSHSGDAEYEEFPLSLLDLSRFFNFEYKDENGQYHPLPDTSENRAYFTIQVEYSRDGALDIDDSMFHQVANSTTWNYYADLSLNDYWNAYTNIIITEQFLNAVYNEAENAYYVTLDREFANYLNTLQMSEINVELDLDNLDYAVYGIDLQNFDFNMQSLTISSDVISELEIYNEEDCSVDVTLNLGGVA